MLTQLAVSTVMVLLTALIHAVGLFTLSRLLRLEALHAGEAQIQPISPRGAMMALMLVLGLFVLHGMEIWLYALLYYLVGAMPEFHQALYLSTITYSTLGYDDEGIAQGWHLVAAIEGINGVILLGWSTAFVVMVATRRRRS